MTIDEMLAEARRRLRRLEPQAAADAMRSGSVLIDVRTGEQRARDGTVPGAVPIALNVLEWRATARADQEVSVMFVQVIQGK